MRTKYVDMIDGDRTKFLEAILLVRSTCFTLV